MEEWKSIPGYEGLYEISSYGRVKSLEISYVRKDGRMYHKPEIILKPNYVSGYLRVGMYKNKTFKYYLIHRLVAQAFLPNPDNLPEVNHLDEDKSNNRVENLEWCDRSYNMNYGTLQQRRIQTNINNGKYTGNSKTKEYRKEYSKKYKKEHIEHTREYHREYMREYRKRKRGQ